MAAVSLDCDSGWLELESPSVFGDFGRLLDGGSISLLLSASDCSAIVSNWSNSLLEATIKLLRRSFISSVFSISSNLSRHRVKSSSSFKYCLSFLPQPGLIVVSSICKRSISIAISSSFSLWVLTGACAGGGWITGAASGWGEDWWAWAKSLAVPPIYFTRLLWYSRKID